eukprot:4233707-Amphidinium_carterae.1
MRAQCSWRLISSSQLACLASCVLQGDFLASCCVVLSVRAFVLCQALAATVSESKFSQMYARVGQNRVYTVGAVVEVCRDDNANQDSIAFLCHGLILGVRLPSTNASFSGLVLWRPMIAMACQTSIRTSLPQFNAGPQTPCLIERATSATCATCCAGPDSIDLAHLQRLVH